MVKRKLMPEIGRVGVVCVALLVAGLVTCPVWIHAQSVSNAYAVFTATLAGLVPPSGGGTVNFQRADGVWAVPPGTGGGGGLTVGTTAVSGGTVGNCLTIATGPVLGSGSCGTGGGGTPAGSFSEYQYNNAGAFGAVTNTGPVPTGGWTLLGSPYFNNFSSDEIGLSVLNNLSPTSYRGAIQSATISGTPYTVIESIDCVGIEINSARSCGLWLSDGTKFETIELISNSNAPAIRVLTGTTPIGGTYAVPGGPTAGFSVPSHTTFKVVDNGANRVWYVYIAGAFSVIFTEASGTFLTPTAYGFGGIDNTTGAAGTQLSMNLKFVCVSAMTTCNGL